MIMPTGDMKKKKKQQQGPNIIFLRDKSRETRNNDLCIETFETSGDSVFMNPLV